jgi:HNH endonuclease
MAKKLDTIKYNDKDNWIVRQAIWECHDCRCAYWGHPIELDDMQIDHILPESLDKEPLKKIQVLEQYKLDQDFILNSLENYVPSSRKANREKGKSILPTATDLLLKKAKRKAPKIITKVNQILQNIDLERSKSAIRNEISGDHQKAENLYNSLTDQDEHFSEEHYVNDYAETSIYHYSKQKILVTSYLPTFSNSGKGSCLIVFKTLKIRNCSITFEHEEILNFLCLGRDTTLDMELRRFVVCQDHHNKNIYYIQLGNVRFPLESETLEVLLEIIDDFASQYLNYIMMLEGCSDSRLFKPSKRRDGFKLFKTEKWLWKLLVEFSWRFDYEEGNSLWHIFDRGNNIIKVYTENKTEQFDSGHHAYLCSENVESRFYDASHEVWVTWTSILLDSEKKQGLSVFSDRKSWNASFTYSWLINELIPYVIYYFSLREDGLLNFFKRKLSYVKSFDQIMYQKFLKKFDSRKYITDGSAKYNSIEINRINTSSDLLRNAHKLQLFFTMQRDIVPIGIEHLSKLLESLCICIRHSSSDDWHYIRSKLSFVDSNNKESIIQDIQRFDQTYNEKYVRSYILDSIFRSFISALETNQLNKDEVKIITDSWIPFIEFYQENILIQRYTNGVLVGD